MPVRHGGWAPTPCHLLGLKHSWFDDMRPGRITRSGAVLRIYKCSRCGAETERRR